MRNVVKGFEFSQMAVPKAIHTGINASFNNFHTPNAPKGPVSRGPHLQRMSPKSPLSTARRPGKNVGIKGGNRV